MRIPRLYIDQPLIPGGEVPLGPEASQHLVQVLRLRPGSTLHLFNDTGYDYPALLVNGDKRRCRVAIQPPGLEEPLPRLQLSLAIGISKGERMDWVIQKAVELGVSRIIPLLSRYSVVRLDAERLEKRMAHWHKVMISACEQSGRRRLPTLEQAMGLEEWLAEGYTHRLGLVLAPDAADPLPMLAPPAPDQEVVLLIGPEGGLADEEIALAARRGFKPVRLGPRILRTETAPLAAIATLQALWGDFRE